MKFNILKNEAGQSLIEILIAIGLAGILIPAITVGFIASREGKAQEGQRLQAVALLNEEQEAVRSIREKSWANLITDGTYHATVSANAWILASGPETINGFRRQFVISSAQRDSNGNLASGTNDPSTKQITYSITWTDPSPGGSITSSEYLSRYINNNSWIQTTQADFQAGTGSNLDTTTSPGSVKITLGGVGGTQITNGTFDTNANGWTYANWGTGGPNITGNYNALGGNPGGYIDINVPKNKNYQAGGYWRQTLITTQTNPTVNISFDYKIFSFDNSKKNDPETYKIYVFVDNSPGIPALGQQVWASPELTGLTNWLNTGQIDISNKIATPGTYYLKIAVWLQVVNNIGPYNAGFDNVKAFANSATFYSSTFDASSSAAFNYLTFSATKPASTSVQLQVATNNDNTSWNYVGPDGTSNSFYTGSGAIPLNIISGRYLKYKAALATTDSSVSPSLDDVSVNYSP